MYHYHGLVLMYHKYCPVHIYVWGVRSEQGIMGTYSTVGVTFSSVLVTYVIVSVIVGIDSRPQKHYLFLSPVRVVPEVRYSMYLTWDTT